MISYVLHRSCFWLAYYVVLKTIPIWNLSRGSRLDRERIVWAAKYIPLDSD